jgi:glycosyltransferase involved in cell wall biosynthesis
MKEFLVSIIMPSFNSEITIEESINSILNQKYKNWELLITDDNSSDNTRNIIMSYAKKDSRIKLFFFEENKGAGVARNHSIDNSSGDYIAFLDSDDKWIPEKLDKQIKFMSLNNIDFCYSYYQKFSSLGVSGVVKGPLSVDYNKLLYSNVIGCLTAVYNVRSLGKHYMPIIRKRQDMGLWLTLLRHTSKAVCYPEVLAYYRTDSGMTQNKVKTAKHQWDFYRNVLKFNHIKTFSVFIIYAYRGFIKSKI